MSDLTNVRLAQLQATADAVLTGCELVLVAIADAPPEGGRTCFMCGNAADVRLSMRTKTDTEGVYAGPDGSRHIPAGTEMFWANACPDHHAEQLSVRLS